MNNSLKRILLITLIALLSFLFFALFINLNLEIILNLSAYAQIVSSYFIFCICIFFFSLFSFIKNKTERLVFIIIAAVLLCTAIYFRLTALEYENIAAVTALLALIFITLTIFNLSINTLNYIKVPIHKLIATSAATSSFVFSAVLAISFYINSDISASNPYVIKVVDSITTEAVKKAQDITFNEDALQNISIEGIEIDQNMINELLQENELIQSQQTTEQVENQIKNELYKLLENYADYVKIILCFLVYGYSRLIFTLLNLVIVPFGYLIVYMLRNFGFFNIQKESVEVERINL